MSKLNSIFASFLFAAVLLFVQTEVFACSCAVRPTVLESFEFSKLVVVTRVVSVEKVREKERDYDIGYIKSTKMVVEKVYKGNIKVGDELTFAQGGGADCVWTFDEKSVGSKFLFYLDEPSKRHPMFENEDKDAQPMYYAIACGRSRGLSGAIDDLLYLDNIDKVRGKTRISGELDSWRSDAPSFANLKIKIIGKNKTYETKTDKNGFYEIYDLPAGVYLIEPQIPKGWKIDLSMLEYRRSYSEEYYENEIKSKTQIPLILKEKSHAGLDLLFVIDNYIGGKVLSPVGKPMKGVCVKAVSTELADGDYRGLSDCTDENGEFKIEELTPRNYILVVNDDGKISSKEPFGVLFYPGVTDRKQAGVVAVDIGKFVEGVNIQIPKTEELIEISGRFLYSDGKPVADEWMKFKPVGNNSRVYEEENLKSDAQGRFTLKIVKGTKGTLSGEMYTYTGEFKNCPELEKIIEKTGNKSTEVKTDAIEIEGNINLTDVKLTFPFPSCAKAKD